MKKLFTALSMTLIVGSCGAKADIIRKNIFQPPKLILGAKDQPAGTKEIEVTTNDGFKIIGFEREPLENMPVILFFHGNASIAGQNNIRHDMVAKAGYGIIYAEYRGYGGNPSTPTQEGIAKDADAFLQFAKTKYPDRPIIVLGHSLGGGVAFDLSTRHKLDALITYGTWSKISNMVPKLARFLIKDPFDNQKALVKSDEPILILHSPNDETISFTEFLELKETAKNSALSIITVALKNRGHSLDSGDFLEILKATQFDKKLIVFDQTKLNQMSGN